MISARETRQLLAEFLGTGLLLAAVVGSGIVTATDGPASVQLFQHAVAVGAALVALILMFGPVSGAHFNPAVTAAAWWLGGLGGVTAARYIGAQTAGAVTGTILTHVSFGLPLASWATTPRTGAGMAVGEAVATAGLVLVIFALVRTDRLGAVPGAVGTWIGSAIFFTASASFANPAVTVARALSDTYTGIVPSSVPLFLVGQAVGTIAAVLLVLWLYPQQDRADVTPEEGRVETADPSPTAVTGGER